MTTSSITIAQKLEAAPLPTLVRQTMLPLLVKDDWRPSAFTQDGSLLLVVAEERSFFVHVATGRELREFKLDNGGFLIWARPQRELGTRVGFTSQARFLDVLIRKPARPRLFWI